MTNQQIIERSFGREWLLAELVSYYAEYSSSATQVEADLFDHMVVSQKTIMLFDETLHAIQAEILEYFNATGSFDFKNNSVCSKKITDIFERKLVFNNAGLSMRLARNAMDRMDSLLKEIHMKAPLIYYKN